VDPDPYSESGSRKAKITTSIKKKLKNFMFISAGCSLLKADDSFVA
jgi:hypothetical protein